MKRSDEKPTGNADRIESGTRRRKNQPPTGQADRRTTTGRLRAASNRIPVAATGFTLGIVGDSAGQLFNNPIPGAALVAGTSAFLAAADRFSRKNRANQPTIKELAKRVAAGAVGLVTKNAIVNDLNALGAEQKSV
jgi:hypothetical protein